MTTANYRFAIVGAGPAGILCVGKLLDLGVNEDDILWLDPEFTVGDLGAKWQEVSSNTKVKLFNDSYSATESFDYDNCAPTCALRDLDPGSTCELSYAVTPLQAITDQLSTRVITAVTTVSAIKPSSDGWLLETYQGDVSANKVILATGAESKLLDLPISTLPLELALTPSALKQQQLDGETIAVFGSSHSAILVIKNCLEAGAKVVNFYRSPIKYAIYHDDWIEFDNTGLKGIAADYAKANMSDESCLDGLVRYPSDEEHLSKYLPECSRAVFAVGFKARSIDVDGVNLGEYDQQTGLIASNLYGCGIAFPERVIDRVGHEELSVGIWKFNNYLDRVMPTWLD